MRLSRLRFAFMLAATLGVAASMVAPATPAHAADAKELLERLTGKKKAGKKPAVQPLAVQADRPADESRGSVATGMTLDDAVHAVRRRHPRDEVVGAQTRTGEDGRAVHEVKVLRRSGKVQTYRFDAASGAIIE